MQREKNTKSLNSEVKHLSWWIKAPASLWVLLTLLKPCTTPKLFPRRSNNTNDLQESRQLMYLWTEVTRDCNNTRPHRYMCQSLIKTLAGASAKSIVKEQLLNPSSDT